MKVKTIASIAALASALVCTAAEHQVVWLDEFPLDGMTSGWREPIKGKSESVHIHADLAGAQIVELKVCARRSGRSR